MSTRIETEKASHELIASCAENAILSVEGVSELTNSPDLGVIIDADKRKGLKVSDSKDGLVIDVWLKVFYGTKIPETAWNVQTKVKKRIADVSDEVIAKVNIHVVGVTFKDDERKL
ncbi:MAG: Asp23/Gls24 family envelope stress response protein [Clostridia bacterium]|nr:Asp23/Gls24 family envelope stress response protein [Clostridia bacterium]